MRLDVSCWWLVTRLFLSRRAGLVDTHAETETHRCQDFLDFIQALAPEVLGLEHLGFGLLHQLADRPDIRVLEAVVRLDRQLELLDALVEVLVARPSTRGVRRRFRRLLRPLLE